MTTNYFFRLCVSMVVIFGTCWFPTNLINFLNDVRFAPMRKDHSKEIMFVPLRGSSYGYGGMPDQAIKSAVVA